MSNKPKFQKRHYEALATMVQGMNDPMPVIDRLVRNLSDLFAADNPNFDRGRFERATVPGANVRART